MDNAHVVHQQILSSRQRHTRAHTCNFASTLREVILHHNTQKTPEAATYIGKEARSGIVKE